MFEKWSETAVFCTFLLQNVRFATAACIFSTSELQKVLPDPQFFNIFTCECRFRHRVVQFCNIRTYKSGPNTSCFVHFHFPMYLSPQRCVIFRHLNVQKCSKHLMFCTFSLPHVLFATAAHNFCDILTSKSASELTCFVHFHLKMCFSPQRRAIFDFSSDHMTPHPPALTDLLLD